MPLLSGLSPGNPGSVPARGVDSWTTVDFNLDYRLDGGQGWMADTNVISA